MRAREDGPLALVHAARGARLVVIPPGEMQEPVNEQQIQFQRDRHANLTRLALRRLCRNHDFAEEGGGHRALEVEGDHVRGPTSTEVAAMEPSDFTVVDDADVDVPIGSADRQESPPSEPAQSRRRDRDASLSIPDADAHGAGEIDTSPSGAAGRRTVPPAGRRS